MIRSLFLLLLLLLPTAALAQQEPPADTAQQEPPADTAQQERPADPAQDAPAVRYPSRTELDMDGIRVAAGIDTPLGLALVVRRSSTFAPLITMRENFDEEMVESVRAMR